MIPFVKGFHLNWHYRSRDESLISFFNHHMYDDRLVTFPGPGGSAAMSHVFVDTIPSSDGQEDSSGGEVQKVVELVLHHARTQPGRTLGVITMGIKHANRIQALLDREVARHPTLASFFDTDRPERFFVKNLERVQGDERDVIILTVGYGKDRAGNLPLRFGPILSAGGRRRLNVAATRAKEQVIVVSSFVYSDINSTQVRPGTGLEFLKNYLQYASSGGALLSHGEMTSEPMNDFEADVYEALSAKGMTIVPQVGCSKFRIDLAASHPTQPGKFVLAIDAMERPTIPATRLVIETGFASSSSKTSAGPSTVSGRRIVSCDGTRKWSVPFRPFKRLWWRVTYRDRLGCRNHKTPWPQAQALHPRSRVVEVPSLLPFRYELL